MTQTPPFTDERRRILSAPKPTKNKPVEIKITGQKDPRGPDNSVFIWLDDDGKLHITVYKAKRCYQFERVDETDGYIDLVAA
jgi:hypothetical protein